jgi:hypothetical protein
MAVTGEWTFPVPFGGAFCGNPHIVPHSSASRREVEISAEFTSIL